MLYVAITGEVSHFAFYLFSILRGAGIKVCLADGIENARAQVAIFPDCSPDDVAYVKRQYENVVHVHVSRTVGDMKYDIRVTCLADMTVAADMIMARTRAAAEAKK